MRKPPSNLRCALMSYHPLRLAADSVAGLASSRLRMTIPQPKDVAAAAAILLQNQYDAIKEIYVNLRVLDESERAELESPPHFAVNLAHRIAVALDLSHAETAPLESFENELSRALADRAATILGWSEDTPNP